MGQVPSLDGVYEDISEDPRWGYLREPGIRLVKGRGQTDNPLAMVILGSPKAIDNTRGRLASGPDGRILEQLMELSGLYTDDDETRVAPNAFITSVVKYRTPGNRAPGPNETLWGIEAIRREWAALGSPQVLVAVGEAARSALIPRIYGAVAPGHMVRLGSGPTVWVQYRPEWALRPGATNSDRRTVEKHWEGMGLWIRKL